MKVKINWKVRFKNLYFLVQIGAAFIVPILAYYKLTAQDLTTWGSVFILLKNAFSNPYVLFCVAVAILNAINDPLTKGPNDSKQGLNYKKPKDDSSYN